MTENVQSMMLDILKRIQGDISDMKARISGIEARISGIEARLDRLETAVKKNSRDCAAMLVMMRGTVGIFDERVSRLEEDVRLIRERE